MKKKKEREPQWYMSSTKIPVLNYNEYYMKKNGMGFYMRLPFLRWEQLLVIYSMVELELIYMENLLELLI